MKDHSPSPDIHIATLSNGMRVAARRSDGHVSYIGVAIGAGSRDEIPSLYGLAHFVEHTIFKGTSRRRSWHISNRMESIGGELNAYTSKEETLIYTNAPAGYAERAVELLADIIANSQFPTHEIEREREVVIEEINSYLDSPADSIFDEFEERIFAGSALAHNILGSPESVRSLTGADCRQFLESNYTPGEMVAYIVDPGDPERNIRLMERYFGDLNRTTRRQPRIIPEPCRGFDETIDRQGHQAHTIIGFPLFGRDDPRRHAIFLLNNYLAGPCMNSRLNRELRDRRGYVYTVESSVSMYEDTGSIFIYFGCDPDKVKKCIRLIHNELDRLVQSPLSEKALEAVKRQYCGQLTVTIDHRESRAMALAKSLMYFGDICDVEAMIDKVREVTPAQIREVAEMIAPCRCSSLSLT